MVPPQWAVRCLEGKWIVFFDELTTVGLSVQAAMLRIMAEGWVGEFELPKTIWMCAASNPPGIAANGTELEVPMANRMIHLPWISPEESYEEGLMNGMKFPEPEFDVLPRS